jgi:hypothetical protein
MIKVLFKLCFVLSLLQLNPSIYSHPLYGQASPVRIKAGFSINTVASVDNAASLGINTAIMYGTPFKPADPVGAEMQARGMHEIDGGVASDLFYYECHRTHTVAPPPPGTSNNYCTTDEDPAMNSEAALLAAIDAKLQADAANTLITGFWVLDDWNLWDAGSAKIVLQVIHAHIMQYAPHRNAICGFGVAVAPPGVNSWEPPLALNYSNAGCDMVGIYSYAGPSSSPSNGSQLDYTMKLPLAAAFSTLRRLGWSSRSAPFIGIGQAFAGVYAGTRYYPGLNRQQMFTQATAFCKMGAASIAWYGWADSGFGSQTLTPMTSTEIQAGITNGITACQAIWGVRNPL